MAMACMYTTENLGFFIDILRSDKKISPIAMPRPEPEDASMSKIIDRNALWYIKQKGKLLTESK